MKDWKRTAFQAWILTAGLAVVLILWIIGRDNRYTLGILPDSADYLDDGRYVFCFWDASDEDMPYERLHILKVDSDMKSITETKEVLYDDPFQVFYMTRQRNGYYSLVSIASWTYLGVDERGRLVLDEEFNGDSGQLWQFHYSGEKYYVMENRDKGISGFENGIFSADNPAGKWEIVRVLQDKTQEDKEND